MNNLRTRSRQSHRALGPLFILLVLAAKNAVAVEPSTHAALIVLPETIHVSPDYPARFVVLQKNADGTIIDRTRQAEITLPRSIEQSKETGELVIASADAYQPDKAQPRQDSNATSKLIAKFDDLSSSAAINVTSLQSNSPIFPREVAAVLGKSGCNLGTCHGNLHGKAGFRLSLRGDDPLFDFNSIVRSGLTRRIDRVAPEESLLLKKATGQVAHQGGQRFNASSEEYRLLKQWIAEGCQWNKLAGREAFTPGESLPDEQLIELSVYPSTAFLSPHSKQQQLAVLARFADGITRDVTRFARYEPSSPTGVQVNATGLVAADQPIDVAISISYLSGRAASRLTFLSHESRPWAPTSANSTVDVLVDQQLRRLQVAPMADADDYTLVRRLYLKTLGRLPTPSEVTEFTTDQSLSRDQRVSRLVDSLLSDRGYALLWSLRWSDLLRNEQKVMSERGAAGWRQWMTDQIAADRPLDEFVSEMLTTLGSTYDHPAASFHRTHRDAETAAESIGQVFLGVRLQCARCHNHPFDKWRQDDYYGLAAYFTTLERTQVENSPKDKFDKHIISGDEVIAYKAKATPVIWHPGRASLVEPKPLLQSQIHVANSNSSDNNSNSTDETTTKSDTANTSETGDASAGSKPLNGLAKWLTVDNRMFARNMANRIWYHYMSIGIVDPPDDFRDSNPASNPELLEYLTDELIRSGYSTRHVARLILTSRTFARASAAEPDSDTPLGGAHVFSGYPLHRMPAEVLFDAITDATGVSKPLDDKSEQPVTRAIEQVEVPTKAGFLSTFGKPGRLLVCECERSSDVSLGQSLVLVNGLETRDKLAAKGNLIATLDRDDVSATEACEVLVMTALARPPKTEELTRFKDYIESAANRRQALEDVLWALLNSKEFSLIR